MKTKFKALAFGVTLIVFAPAFSQGAETGASIRPVQGNTIPNPMGTTRNDASTMSNTPQLQLPARLKRNPRESMTAADHGGNGQVWVNTASKTYHCAGTRYYGRTKVGEYMSEAEAKAKGNHANHKKVCA